MIPIKSACLGCFYGDRDKCQIMSSLSFQCCNVFIIIHLVADLLYFPFTFLCNISRAQPTQYVTFSVHYCMVIYVLHFAFFYNFVIFVRITGNIILEELQGKQGGFPYFLKNIHVNHFFAWCSTAHSHMCTQNMRAWLWKRPEVIDQVCHHLFSVSD